MSEAAPAARDAVETGPSEGLPGRLGLALVPSLYTVALLAVLGAVFIVGIAPRLDTDLWWHLKVGQYIWQHHVVPSRDFMSYTFAGHGWTDHEWLAELGLYGLYRLGGLWALVAFFALVVTVTFALVYARMVQLGLNRILALFLLVAAFVASSASWGPRIQLVTLLFLAVYMLALRRFELTRNRRLLVIFPLVMLLWTNLHGGFVLGLVVVAATLAGEALNRWTRAVPALSPADLRALGLTLAATLAVTVVNPNGLRQLLYPLTFILPNAYTNQIQESASPDFHTPVIMVFEAMLLLLIASLFVQRPRLNWTHLLLVLAFTHLALSQVRNVPLWSVIVAPLVGYYVQAAAPAVRAMLPRLSYRRRAVSGRLAPFLNLTLLLLAAAVYAIEVHTYISGGQLKQVERESYPAGAVSYLGAHRLPPHVFAAYEWGGYLLWRLFPRYRDYMDSRADTLYSAPILNGYLEAVSATPQWRAVLDRYAVQTVLIKRTAPLAQVLALDRRWKLVYRDRLAVLYTRR